jgi:hypothetical protein
MFPACNSSQKGELHLRMARNSCHKVSCIFAITLPHVSTPLRSVILSDSDGTLTLSVFNYQSLAFPAILAISPCPSACVPSARYPPPIDALLKAKGKPKFDSTVDRTVEASFRPFSPVKSVSLNRCFGRCNPLPMHRSAVGRVLFSIDSITKLPIYQF